MMGYGYSYEISDLVVPEPPNYEARKLHIGIITGMSHRGSNSSYKEGSISRKYKVFWLTTDGEHVTLWHVGGELKMISPHEGFEARFNKYRL